MPFSISRRWELNSGCAGLQKKLRRCLCWFVYITLGEVCILGLKYVRWFARCKLRRRSSWASFLFFPFLFPTQQSDLKMSSSVIICPRSWVTLAEHKELATFRLLWWHCTFLLKSSATFTKGRRASGWRCRRGYVKTHRVAEAKNGGFICCLDCDPAVSNRLTRASNWITPDFSVDHIDISARGGW